MRISVLCVLVVTISAAHPYAAFGASPKRSKKTAVKPQPKKPVVGDARLSLVREELGKRGFSAEEISKLLSNVPLYEPYNILTEKSVSAGASFVQKHSGIFAATWDRYGVADADIAAVFRKETYFGRNTGRHPAVFLLYTKVLKDDPDDWRWSAANLVDLLVFCRAEKIPDCRALRGSDAAALGLGQFLPRAITDFGVDGNGDGKIDPWNPEDAIMSTANFLRGNGWPAKNAKSADALRQKRDALSRYYAGLPYARSRQGRGYANTALAYADAIRTALGNPASPETPVSEEQTTAGNVMPENPIEWLGLTVALGPEPAADSTVSQFPQLGISVGVVSYDPATDVLVLRIVLKDETGSTATERHVWLKPYQKFTFANDWAAGYLYWNREVSSENHAVLQIRGFRP